jgi:predicted Holliday junction resolvase-like endonuclease
MDNETLLVLLILAVVALSVLVCCLLVLTAKFYWQKRIAVREATVQLQQWKLQFEKSIRGDAISRSQNVITGNVTQHLAPYLPQFQFNPKDVRFVGSPIDLIVFDGMCDGDLKDIIFIEVKTGRSAKLNSHERQVRDAVEARRIRWVELRIDRAPELAQQSAAGVEPFQC